MMSPVLCFQTPLESIVLSHKDIQNQGVDPGTYEEQVQHFLLASRCVSSYVWPYRPLPDTADLLRSSLKTPGTTAAKIR